jgi:hypothetical protein
MAFRVQLTKAAYIDPPGPGRLRAGQWVVTDPTIAQPGDVVWLNGDVTKLPAAGVTTITGADSVSG